MSKQDWLGEMRACWDGPGNNASRSAAQITMQIVSHEKALHPDDFSALTASLRSALAPWLERPMGDLVLGALRDDGVVNEEGLPADFTQGWRALVRAHLVSWIFTHIIAEDVLHGMYTNGGRSVATLMGCAEMQIQIAVIDALERAEAAALGKGESLTVEGPMSRMRRGQIPEIRKVLSDEVCAAPLWCALNLIKTHIPDMRTARKFLAGRYRDDQPGTSYEDLVVYIADNVAKGAKSNG